MFARIERGWSIAVATFAVLSRYPKLLILPAISFVLLIGAMAAFGALIAGNPKLFGVLFPGSGISARWISTDFGFSFLATAGVAGYLLTAISIFFNAALVRCALDCFAGREPSISEGLKVAASRLPQILGWTLLTVTVGLVLNLIGEMLGKWLGFLGDLLGGLMHISWAIMTYFVVPVVVVEGTGPVAAVQSSSTLLRRTWGESLALNAGLGVIGFLLVLPALALFGGALAYWYWLGATGPLATGLIAVAALYGLAVIITTKALRTLFVTGAYVYATTGQAPAAIDPALLRDVFRKKS